MPTRTRARQRSASFTRKPASRRSHYLGETSDWMTYEFPPYEGPPHRLAKFRGQRQKWFAFRFTGSEREIVVADRRNDQEPEFDAWRWEPLANVAALVVPFRREVYAAVAREFARFAADALSLRQSLKCRHTVGM